MLVRSYDHQSKLYHNGYICQKFMNDIQYQQLPIYQGYYTATNSCSYYRTLLKLSEK